MNDLVGRGRKSLSLPSGLEVQIRRLTGMEFARAGILPKMPEGYNERRMVKQLTDEDNEFAANLTGRIIQRAVLAPSRIWSGEYEEMPEGWAHLSDLDPEDVPYLVTEILAWSGLGGARSVELATFRPEPTGGDAGSGGTEVRDDSLVVSVPAGG